MREFGEKEKDVEYLIRPSSYSLIIKDGRIGVIRSNSFNKYFLVGGGIKKGETEMETLYREAIEEIGFQIEVGEKIGEATEYFYAEIDKQFIVKVCSFYRTLLKNKVKKKTEHKLLWINKDELGNMYHRSHKWIIEQELEL